MQSDSSGHDPRAPTRSGSAPLAQESNVACSSIKPRVRFRRSYLSQLLQTNAGAGSPGSTITELNSPQRPHCRESLVGSFVIGLVAAFTA